MALSLQKLRLVLENCKSILISDIFLNSKLAKKSYQQNLFVHLIMQIKTQFQRPLIFYDESRNAITHLALVYHITFVTVASLFFASMILAKNVVNQLILPSFHQLLEIHKSLKFKVRSFNSPPPCRVSKVLRIDMFSCPVGILS